MSTWLKLLPLELNGIEENEFCEPETEVDPTKDHMVGEMSLDLKRIYTHWRGLRESADRAVLDAKYAKGNDQREALFMRAIELHEKAEVMEDIFWISLKDEFGLWGRENSDNTTGVRKGFKVVSLKSEVTPKTFLDFLRGLQ